MDVRKVITPPASLTWLVSWDAWNTVCLFFTTLVLKVRRKQPSVNGLLGHFLWQFQYKRNDTNILVLIFCRPWTSPKHVYLLVWIQLIVVRNIATRDELGQGVLPSIVQIVLLSVSPHFDTSTSHFASFHHLAEFLCSLLFLGNHLETHKRPDLKHQTQGTRWEMEMAMFPPL